MEEWRPLPDWPYEVSNLGRIRRAKSGRTTRKNRVLRPSATKSGHLTTTLNDHPRKRTARINRIVCEVWHGPPPTPQHEAAHLNGDPMDNRPENLAWTTHRENEHHKTLHGTANITPIAVQEAIVARLQTLKGQNGGRAPHRSLHQLSTEFEVPYHVVSRLSYLIRS